MPPQGRSDGIAGPPRLEPALAGLSAGHLCIAGIGNRLKGDDAAGPLVIDRLRGGTAAVLIDAGVAPENFLEKIAERQPDTVVLIDATDFGGRAGEIRICDPQDLDGAAVSTHALSLRLVAEYLRRRGVGRVALIGIQPGAVTLGGALTPAVADAITTLAEALLRMSRAPAP